MKSVYALRLYELLQSKIMTRVLPKSGTDIELSLDTIKECCGFPQKSCPKQPKVIVYTQQLKNFSSENYPYFGPFLNLGES